MEDANFNFAIEIAASTAAAAGCEGERHSDCRSTGGNTPGKKRDHVGPHGENVPKV